jgi:hypothetical protein
MKVADFPEATHCLFCFESINSCLDGGIRGPGLLRKRFLNLTNGTGAAAPPQLLESVSINIL